MEEHLAHIIAMDRLLSENPELRKHESLHDILFPTIEDIDIPENEKTPYKAYAYEVMDIAFKNCRGKPKNNPGNDIEHGGPS